MADWIDIQIEYALGEKSVEELARDYGKTVASIEQRAMREGWPCEGIHALSFMRQRFVEEYFVDFRTSAAALRTGVSEATGYKFIAMPEVQKAIAARMREMRLRTGINQDKIIGRMAAIAFGDIGDLYDEAGAVRPLHELSEEQRAMIESIETVEGKAEGGNVLLQTKKIKTVTKAAQLGYLERLGKYKGLFNDKLEIEAKVESTEATPNDIARRLAFILLAAARKKKETLTEDED